MINQLISFRITKLFAGIVVGILFALPVLAQTDQGQVATSKSATQPLQSSHKTSPYRSKKLPPSANNYYQAQWGIDNLRVSQTASGNLIRFSYQVVEPVLAKPLGDKQAQPFMYGQRSRAVLEIPVMDKIGQLRQTNVTEKGKEYWMVFSNKGNLVKVGDRVDVRIGVFHADGLMVE